MKMSKKLSLIAFGASALSLVAVAAPRLDDSIPQLNAVAVEILAPFQTPKSKATLEFLSIATDAANVRSLKARAYYERTGKAQTMKVTLKELSHEFAGGRPVTKATGGASIDLTRLFNAEQADSLVDGAEEMVADMVSNYTAPYGDAVTLEPRMIEKVKGADGHYESFKAAVTAKIDLSKLPNSPENTKKPEDVAFLEATVTVSVVMTTGIELTAEVQHNPQWKGFQANDAQNFKTVLEKFLAGDQPSRDKVIALLKKVDTMAANLVNANARPRPAN